MQTGYQEIFHFPITIWEVLANVMIATICGALVALFYSLTYRQLTFSVSFAKSIVMLSMITSFVMMVIGDNLARAFGMVGLISLIQFRTTMKGARDFMFMYFALGIGLASGVGLHLVSLVGTFTIGGIIWLVTRFKPAISQQQVLMLQVSTSLKALEERELEEALKKFCLKYKLMNSKAGMNGDDVILRLSYQIILKNSDNGYCLISEVHRLGGKDISIQLVKD